MRQFHIQKSPGKLNASLWWCALPLLAALAALLLFAQSTHACSCVEPPPPEDALANASAVFAGKVTKIKEINTEGVQVTFKIYTSWKGPLQAEMVVWTSSSSASCGFSFKKGEEYLVYAVQQEDGKYAVSLCSRTKLLNTSGEDLDVLKEGSTPLQPAGDVSALNKFFSSWAGVVTIGIGLGVIFILFVLVRDKILHLSRHTLPPPDSAEQPDKPEK